MNKENRKFLIEQCRNLFLTIPLSLKFECTKLLYKHYLNKSKKYTKKSIKAITQAKKFHGCCISLDNKRSNYLNSSILSIKDMVDRIEEMDDKK